MLQKFGPTNIREANRTDFPIGLALALIDKESEFQNIFGADTGAPFAQRIRPGSICTSLTTLATASTVSSVTSTP